MADELIHDQWAAILSRIGHALPVDLDSPDHSNRAPTLPVSAGQPPPAAVLWNPGEGAVSYLGIRLRAPLADCAGAAARLAAAAMERGVVPVILSTLDISGFERFGFRVERIAGMTEAERAACEAQIARFWQLAIIIDAGDIGRLG